MPKKKPAKLRLDANELAFRTVHAALGEGEKPLPPGTDRPKNPDAVARGAKGGKKGGKAKAAKLSPSERSEAARIAATARWRRGE